MRAVHLDPAPALLGFGVLTPAGVGADTLARKPAAPMAGCEVTTDLASACGPWSVALRRTDRYGALGFTAARLAFVDAGLEPPAALDADWGVMIGSSLGCWGSNARYHGGLSGEPGLETGPALFVRTVSNAVNGDITITWRLGGPAATFVSGWTAGAEALIAAGSAIAAGQARRMLAGGVEAPEGPFRTMHAGARRTAGSAWLPSILAEGAAVAVMGAAEAPGALRLRAFARGTDRSGAWSLARFLRDLEPLPIGRIVVANTLPPSLRGRIGDEAEGRQIIDLPRRSGEIGAAGAVAGVALAAARLGPDAGGRARSPGGAVVLARGTEGGLVAMALGA